MRGHKITGTGLKGHIFLYIHILFSILFILFSKSPNLLFRDFIEPINSAKRILLLIDLKSSMISSSIVVLLFLTAFGMTFSNSCAIGP